MEALVTGGAGFIGSNLVARLVRSGHRVRVLDDLSTGRLENLADAGGSVEMVAGDVRDRGTVIAAADGVAAIWHLAALPSVARSVRDPDTTHAVNVDGTLNVLAAARVNRVRRVVYASSSSVYGDTPVLPKREDMAQAPLSPYAASKLAGEAYCRAFSASSGVETVSLRFFNVFGPRQDPQSEYAAVVPRFITRMLAGEAPTIYGDGLQSRDFTFIDNVTRACELAATAGNAAVGEAFNVGCGERFSLLDLVEELKRLLGSDVVSTFAPRRAGDVMHSEASVLKASRLLGYRPHVGFREGLAETIRWFIARNDAAGAMPSAAAPRRA